MKFRRELRHRTCSRVNWVAYRAWQGKCAEKLWFDGGGRAVGGRRVFAARVVTSRIVRRFHAMAARTL